jgi:hypothetical protein
MHYKERAKREFEDLLPVRGEREAIAVVAGRYWVSKPTLRSWLGLQPDPEERAEDAEQRRRQAQGKPAPNRHEADAGDPSLSSGGVPWK